MQEKYRHKTKRALPAVDIPTRMMYCCPFCRFSTEEPGDMQYHTVGYHKVFEEFFDDF